MISHVSSGFRADKPRFPTQKVLPTPSVSSGVRSPALQHPALRGLPAGRGPATAELRGRSLCQGTEMTVNRDGGQCDDS